MTSAELRAEILARLDSLGRGHGHRVSVIARAGEQHTDGAVWAALEQLWVEGKVDHLGDDRYRLPQTPAPIQLHLGGAT